MTTVYAPPTLESDPKRQNQALQDHASKISTLTDALTNNTYGFVKGPASSTNNGFVRYDGTTGKLVKDGAATVALATEVSGNLPVANLNSGTSADSSSFWRGNGTWSVPVLVPLIGSLGADVAMNNTANYFPGPFVAQGTSGIWFVSGTVTVRDTAGAAGMLGKLWDGSNIISTGRTDTSAANFYSTLTLSGYISSPAGNLRLDVRDSSSTSGVIIFNATGNSKDSTITAIRIG